MIKKGIRSMGRSQNNTRNYVGIFLPVGIGAGTALGAAIHNIGVGMCIGAFFGVTLSLLVEHLSPYNPEEE